MFAYVNFYYLMLSPIDELSFYMKYDKKVRTNLCINEIYCFEYLDARNEMMKTVGQTFKDILFENL